MACLNKAHPDQLCEPTNLYVTTLTAKEDCLLLHYTWLTINCIHLSPCKHELLHHFYTKIRPKWSVRSLLNKFMLLFMTLTNPSEDYEKRDDGSVWHHEELTWPMRKNKCWSKQFIWHHYIIFYLKMCPRCGEIRELTAEWGACRIKIWGMFDSSPSVSSSVGGI